MLIIYVGKSGSGKTTYVKEYIKSILSKESTAKICVVGCCKDEYSTFDETNVNHYESIDDLDEEKCLDYKLVVIENYQPWINDKDLTKIKNLIKNNVIIATMQFMDWQEEIFLNIAAEIRYCDRCGQNFTYITRESMKYRIGNHIKSMYGEYSLENLEDFAKKHNIKFLNLYCLMMRGYIYEDDFEKVCKILNVSDEIKKYWRINYAVK